MNYPDLSMLGKKKAEEIKSYIDTIEMRLKEAQDKLFCAQTNFDSKVTMPFYLDTMKALNQPFHLPDDETYRFKFGDHSSEYVDIRIRDKMIVINSGESLRIEPSSANWVEIGLKKR